MQVVPREMYDHPGPLGPSLDLRRVTGFDLHHTAGPVTDDPYADVLSVARATARRFGRSSYNFAVHPRALDTVFEMQGLHIGAHNDGENSTRIGVVVVGNYERFVPSTTLLELVADFCRMSARRWNFPAHIKGHRDTDATLCPGAHLYAGLSLIRKRMSGDMMEGHDPADRKMHSTVPHEWGDEAWRDYVDAGGSSVEESRVWPAYREDIAFLAMADRSPIVRRFKAMAADIAALTSEVADLKAAAAFSGVTAAQARSIAKEEITRHAGNPDAHHD